MSASEGGHYNVTKLLLEKGAKVDLQNNNAWSSLMVAIQAGQIKVVKLLLDYGAKIHFLSVKGESALSLAMRQGNSEMIALIESKVWLATQIFASNTKLPSIGESQGDPPANSFRGGHHW